MSFGRESGPASGPKSSNPFTLLRPPSPPSTTVRSFRGAGAQRRFPSPPASFETTHSASNSYRAVGDSRPVESPSRWDDGQGSSLGEYVDQAHSMPSAVTSLFALHSSENSVTAKISRQELKRSRSPPFWSADENASRYTSQAAHESHSNVHLNSHGHLFPPRTRSPSSAFENNPSAKNFHSSFGEFQGPALSPFTQNNHAKFSASNPSSSAHQDQSFVSPSDDPYDYRRSTNNEANDMQASERTRSPSIASEISQEHPRSVQNNSRRPSASPPRLGSRSNVLFSNPDSQFPRRSLPAQTNNASTAPKTTTTFPAFKRTRSPPLRFQDRSFQENSNQSQDDAERELQAKAKRLARFKGELSAAADMRPTDTADQNISASRYQRSIEERKKLVGQQSTESTGNFIDGNALSDFEGLEASSIIVGLCPDMCPEAERAERERKGDLDHYERLDGDRNQTNKLLAIKKYNRTAERDANLIRPMPVLQKTIDYLLNLLDQPYDDRFLGIYNFLWDRMRAIRMDLRMQHIFDQEAITMLEQMIRLHIIAMHELCEYTKGEGFSEGFDAHLNIEQMNKTSVELFQMYDDHRKKGIHMHTEKEFRGYYALLKLDKHPGYKVEPAELSLDLAKMTPEIRQTPEVLLARDAARACRTGNFVAFFRLARKASYLQACLMHAHFAKLRTQALASLHSSLQNSQGLPVIHVSRWLGMEEEDIESLLEYHGFSIREFEEPYMVKEGPFLNPENDYPTKCSRLVHLKRSKRIVEDVSDSCRRVSLSMETTKEKQLGKIYKHDPKATASIERSSSILATDAEMPDYEIISSPKEHTQAKSMVETSTVDQHGQQGHYKTGATFSPWGFSPTHNSPRTSPAQIESTEKVNNDAVSRISSLRKMVFSMEGMPSQIMSRPSLLERSPSGKYDCALENAVPRNMAIDNLKTLPERSSSGKYGNVVEKSVAQSMTNKSPPVRSPSGKYNCSVGNSVPKHMVVNELEAEEPPDIQREIEKDEVMENCQDEEVYEAKLKLILRLWKRRSAKLKELREQRQLAAETALNSLSLGLPIRPKKDLRSTFGELDFDHVMRERIEKHERSWSRLNVSDVVAGILGQRNPTAKCLCWKIVFCSQVKRLEGDQLIQKSQVAHLEAGSWLLSKLMPSREENDNDLIVSHHGLSIWKKWFSNQFGTDLSCCLSVIKDVKLDDLNETVAGASAVLFLVSESLPWTLQKVQLHDLLMSIPPGSCLPLLILSGSINEVLDPYSIIVNELGLHEIDKSRISGFLIVFLTGDQELEQSSGFFCDEQLRKGLQWLASESPLQPVLHSVKARELVMSHLSPSLELLNSMSDYEVGPNNCISVFNEALDWSLKEISATAEANPTHWPCPEIVLLEDSSNEHLLVKWHLPSVGWSSTTRTAPLEGALQDCKLSSFLDDLSWLHRGSSTVEEIESQRLQLENCLIRYLTQSSKIMGVPLATKEACVMLQRSTRLELRTLRYYLVPNWVSIFRRIFNWRLTSLSTGAFSSAYVLQCHIDKPGDFVKLQLEDNNSPPYCFIRPSIDEIIDISCSPLKSQKNEREPQDFQNNTVSSGETHGEKQEVAAASTWTKHGDFSQNGRLANADDFAHTASKLNSHDSQILVPTKAADNLSSLLERCSLLQNEIGEKLSVYF